jgi:hypothetical protein
VKRDAQKKLGMCYLPSLSPSLFIRLRLCIERQLIRNEMTLVLHPYHRLYLARLLLIGLMLLGNRSLRAYPIRIHTPLRFEAFIPPSDSLEDAVLLSSVA